MDPWNQIPWVYEMDPTNEFSLLSLRKPLWISIHLVGWSHKGKCKGSWMKAKGRGYRPYPVYAGGKGPGPGNPPGGNPPGGGGCGGGPSTGGSGHAISVS